MLVIGSARVCPLLKSTRERLLSCSHFCSIGGRISNMNHPLQTLKKQFAYQHRRLHTVELCGGLGKPKLHIVERKVYALVADVLRVVVHSQNPWVRADEVLPEWMTRASSGFVAVVWGGGDPKLGLTLKKDMGVIQLHLSRNTSGQPVLNTLNTASFFHPKQGRNFRRPTQFIDKLCVSHDRY